MRPVQLEEPPLRPPPLALGPPRAPRALVVRPRDVGDRLRARRREAVRQVELARDARRVELAERVVDLVCGQGWRRRSGSGRRLEKREGERGRGTH